MANGATSPPRARPARISPAAPRMSPLTLVALIVVAVAALYLGRDIFVPLALAILLSFALAPIVVRLRRWGLGRMPSVLAVVFLVFVAIAAFGGVVATQIVDLADNLPIYEMNLRGKIRELRSAGSEDGIVARTSDMMRDLSKELEAVTDEPAEGIEGRAGDEGEIDVTRPVPVEVHAPEPSPLEALRQVVGPLLGPVTTAGLVLVFVIFILLQREDLRDRLIRLAGSGDVHRTTEALDDAAHRISRYLLMHLVINVLYGVPVGIGLYFIGVPNPLLWGLLATVLRFIPYIGPVVAALFPIALSFAVDPGWTMPLLTVALFLGLELFSNNLLEPWLYGSSTGLSSVAVLVAAVFWTMLWGPVGLLLSTPLTVCLVVLGRHVPQMQFLDVLLGNEPALPVEVKFYQRMLARDPDEATELAEDYLEDNALEDLYEEIITPALGFAERDRVARGIDRETTQAIAEDVIDIIDDLAAEDESAATEDDVPADRPSVLCIGARNALDEAAAAMLSHLLRRHGIGSTVLPSRAVSLKTLSRLERDGVMLVCLSYVNPAAQQHARRLVKRLRAHFGDRVEVMIGLWNAEAEARETATAIGADSVVPSLRQAVREIRGRLQEMTRPAASQN